MLWEITGELLKNEKWCEKMSAQRLSLETNCQTKGRLRQKQINQ